MQAAIRAQATAVVGVAGAAVDVTTMVFVMNGGDRFPSAPARRSSTALGLVLRGRGPGLDQ
ncbi:hypothetical protein [Streptomyces platensis]|uniref:hypothetical protein n=1 Tax=Streptomyces platensis TaxID=58346 RepID=UPI00386F15FB|nr:hypothetical protein OG962_00145 [Streptomyces platensis]